MGQGFTSCMDCAADAPAEERMEASFVRCLVCQAGLVLAAQKPAAIFSFASRPGQERSLAARLASVYARELARFGVTLTWLADRDRAVSLLVWRGPLVRERLADPAVLKLLGSGNLPTHGGEQGLMSALVARLRAFYGGHGGFPHELGVVLGYPVEDVCGFMADGGQAAQEVGRWMVYGDVRAARERMAELDRLERQIKRLYSEGVPVRELLRSVAA